MTALQQANLYFIRQQLNLLQLLL